MIRFVLRWSLRAAAFLLLAVTAAVLARDWLLREWLVHRLGQVTGLPSHLAAIRTDVRAGTVRLDGLKLENSPDFGGGTLVAIPELVVELDATALRRREYRLRSARLHLAECNVVRNPQGETNLIVLRQTVERRAGLTEAILVAPPGLRFAGVDRLELTVGTVRLTDLSRTPPVTQAFEVGITNEVVRHVRTLDDFTPLLLQVLFREISEAWSRPRDRPARAVERR